MACRVRVRVTKTQVSEMDVDLNDIIPPSRIDAAKLDGAPFVVAEGKLFVIDTEDDSETPAGTIVSDSVNDEPQRQVVEVVEVEPIH